MRIRLWAAFVFGFGWGLQDKLMIPGPLDILSILYSTIVIEAIQEIGEGSLLAAILVGSTILFGVFLGFYALMELYDEIRGFLINTGFPAAIVIFFAYLSGWG
ncbi:MAG: hypothetical protein QME57_03770, partial [Patescibacteria group bacterium]|nr:hypothetical protein [Patescibacteria group bacterium]